ncbi:MAG: hypothetical protein J7494_15045 [Sphingobium sp.]|nr:hypothetical protein [Sphingobium sp.]
MAEIRPAASLTSGLLARRGDARPAMRRQAVSHLHLPLTPHDDLGWNDHGDEDEDLRPTVASLGLTPPDQRPLVDQQEDFVGDDVEVFVEEQDRPQLSPITRHLETIAQRLSSVARDTSSKPISIRMPSPRPKKLRADPGLSGRKAAFTLRLDAERHLRLRLLSALTHRSSQQLLLEALDALLAQHNKVEDLAGRVEEIDGAGESDF